MPFERKTAEKMLSAGLLLTVTVVAFLLFIRENRGRIVRQNTSYVQEVTTQTAQRVSELLARAQESVSMIANLYGQTMTSPEADPETLIRLSEESRFDMIEFAGTDGMIRSPGQEPVDISGRFYFQDGIRGGSGMDLIFDPEATDGVTVVFYSPLRYQGEIAGVLVGHYREDQLRGILKTSFFGESAGTFLCLKDGTVVSASEQAMERENIFSYLEKSGLVPEATLREIRRAFADGTAYSTTYKSSDGDGVAYMAQLPEKDWMILQTFPPRITRQMLVNASAAGGILEIELVAAFVIYVVVLIVADRRQKKKLLCDNDEMAQVITGITQVFDRFILVDFENNTYKFMGDVLPDIAQIPLEGEYQALADFIVSTFLEEEERDRFREVFRQGYIQDYLKTHVNLHCEYKSRGDAALWVNLNIICVRKKEDVPVMVLFTRQDVTEAKWDELRAHTALKEALQAAEKANHAKSDFLSRMSHDIRTPMNAIMGMTSIAAMHIKDPTRVQECLNKIAVSNDRLLSLVNEVLDMSKIESGKVSLSEEAFDLREAVGDAVQVVLPQVEVKKQNLDVNIADISHADVIGDFQRMGQVVMNLLENAVRFTPEGGKIWLTVREKESVFAGNGCYEIVVTDNGIGIGESFIDHIFEPFSRAGDSRTGRMEGIGMGLPIAKNIVEMMNGDIRVESAPGEGSRFTVTVYLKLSVEAGEDGQTGEETEDAAGQELVPEARCEGKRVLVVEDNELNMEIAEELLTFIGLVVEKAFDGKQAVDRLLATPPHYYDLVLMDIQMPNMNGYEAARAIRASGRPDLVEIPIAAMTADAFKEDVNKAKSAGMNAHIAKPIEIEKLSKILESL